MLLLPLPLDLVEQKTDHRLMAIPIVDAAAAAVDWMTMNPVDSHILEHIHRMDEHRAWLGAADEVPQDAPDSSEVPHILALDDVAAHELAENSIDDDWVVGSSDTARSAAAAVVLLVQRLVVVAIAARIWTERREMIEANLCCDGSCEMLLQLLLLLLQPLHRTNRSSLVSVNPRQRIQAVESKHRVQNHHSRYPQGKNDDDGAMTKTWTCVDDGVVDVVAFSSCDDVDRWWQQHFDSAHPTRFVSTMDMAIVHSVVSRDKNKDT